MAQNTDYFERVYRDATTGNHVVPELVDGAQQVKLINSASQVYIVDYNINEVAQPVATFKTQGKTRLFVNFAIATNALDVFEVRYKSHDDAQWSTRASATADFTTPNYPILGADSDLTGAAVGDHYLILDTEGAYAVQLWAASSNAAGSTLQAWGSAS